MSVELNDIASDINEINENSEGDTSPTPAVDFSVEKEPNAYAKFVASHSKLAFGLGLRIHLFMLLITAVLAASDYDILAFDFESLPLSLQEDSTKLRTDAWWHAQSDKSVITSSSLAEEQEERSVLYQTLELVYELKEGNVFSRKSLLTIKANEDQLFNDSTYQSKLCQLQGYPNQTCKLPLSTLRFFDGTYKHISPVFYDPEFKDIVSVFSKAKEINTTSAILAFHLGKDAIIDKEKNLVTSKYTRSLIYFGWPIKGYKNTVDLADDQKEELNERISAVFLDQLDNSYENKLGDMNFYYFNEVLYSKSIQKQVIWDMLLAVASFLFIFIFMWLQTGSLWLTSWGIFSITSSFNISYLIFRVIFDYKYIGIFHVMSIFIILGIGSDNIFVFVETWKELRPTGQTTSMPLVYRLSMVYRSAAKATLITSLTTAAAFLSNVISPLFAVSSFGLFSAILVTVNYFSSILFFPTVIVRHEFSRKGRCCCFELCCQTTLANSSSSMLDPESNRKDPDNFIVRFLKEWFFQNIVAHRTIRWIVLFCFAILITVFLGYALALEPAEEQVKIMGANTNWEKISDLRQEAFLPSQEDNVVVVYIIWGLKEPDRSGCHSTDYKCKGKTVFDKSFDLNPPPCQKAMMELCKKFQSLPPQQERNLQLRRSEITGEVEIQCVFKRLNEWLEKESNKSKYPSGSDFTMPVSEKKIKPLMSANPLLFNVSILPDTYYRYFEIALSFFLIQGGSPEYANSYDFKVYSKLVEGAIDEDISGNDQLMQGGKYGNRLLYMAIAANTTLNPSRLSFVDGLPVYDNWEEFVNNEMNEMPSSCNNGFQATVDSANTWQWLKIQKILVSSAITGILVGLLFAFIVLILATTNVLVGVLATLTISFTTCTVLGMTTILGWKLGVIESLNLTLVVGLAVDYAVHLAEGYMKLKGENRLNRVRHTLAHVGISVLSGACTTLGASVFMLAAKIVLFFQFGIFIFCTIGSSILFSLLFFTTILGLIGPEADEKGSIIPAVQYLKDYLRGKRKGDIDCVRCEGKGYIRIN